ncbi:hypothetical protein [Sphingomonas sp.]|uniref:hypothetical protein n=1 Tax=Sphingomonas sp. TaxID=28214 RepID=UPI002B82DE1F|nr:hypothetical protein [Sphingomonas sp.]HWK34746.1 hypothetical protein [Sphingomonas sp.]
MRKSSLIVLLALAGCGSGRSDPAAIARADAEAKASGDRVDCAPPGADTFAPVCTIQRERGADGLVLTIRQPDGGFHRLRKTQDGRGVIAADGAEPAVVSVVDPATIEVAIGGARYRLPATVGPLPKAP